MATAKQDLGQLGERVVVRQCSCPRCKRTGTLVQLPPNFKCADVICDFCGYLAQVKAATATSDKLPKRILGGAWGPQKERMGAGIYFPLFIVLVRAATSIAIYYLPADLQVPAMFEPRKPLSAAARRAGWQGFVLNLAVAEERLVRLLPNSEQKI